jgi:sulfide dehydrogenase cytochrome subunit
MRSRTQQLSLTWLMAWVFFIPINTAIAGTFTPHIQTLSASCAACHGSYGNSLGETPVLAGLNEQYFIEQMIAFRQGSRASTVMHRHAKGLILEEIQQLAIYFSQQKRMPTHELKSQIMKGGSSD